MLPLLQGDQDNVARTFLDLGTCLGQDVRKLIFDGAPVDSVYGTDLLAEFVEIGYDLFRDEEKLLAATSSRLQTSLTSLPV